MNYAAWRAANRGKTRKQSASHEKARIGSAGFSAKQWAGMKEAWGHACAYCLRTDRPLTIDHVEPISKGGQHDESNIVPACRSCNARKRQRGILIMTKEAA